MKFWKEQIRSATVYFDALPIRRRLKAEDNKSLHEATSVL